MDLFPFNVLILELEQDHEILAANHFPQTRGAVASEPGTVETVIVETGTVETGTVLADPLPTANFGKNGEEMTLFGTIEEVVKEVASINPDYVWAEQDPNTAHTAGLEEDDAWLERKVSKLDCSAIGTRALRNPIKMGIHYLYTKPKDTCRLEARSCTRVSCSWDSAIYVCFDPNKDSPKVYELPWWYVADYAKGLF
ncbi:unnamed protein product [Parascedosporium putredinis]|uniref:Uncharacterized protein n=1 Tax=Parascedosporium putredinis TaxID=1442378 RepID=A0A9P1MB72_9PEZI|nr:unnamed protein product [Parascedosporium putredinis]CAI7994081.1 unnamed protein product [Parascedosporium putredinis]